MWWGNACDGRIVQQMGDKEMWEKKNDSKESTKNHTPHGDSIALRDWQLK